MSDPSGNVGNLLSNVGPPSALPPNLILAPAAPPVNQDTNPPAEGAAVEATAEPHIPTTFSPAIPPNKNTSAEQTPADETSSQSDNLGHLNLNPEPVSAALGPLTQSGSSLFGWVKDAASSGGGILSKVAEKAKNSVDTLVTTLDPQMKEYIYSGGDVELIVASDKDDKVKPCREAFQNVFGKATVIRPSTHPTATRQLVYKCVWPQWSLLDPKYGRTFLSETNNFQLKSKLNYPEVAHRGSQLTKAKLRDRFARIFIAYFLLIHCLFYPKSGLQAQPNNIAVQPVGFEAALRGAQERTADLRTNSRIGDKLPVVAVENFTLEAFPDQWFDAGLLLLTDPLRNVTLKTVTQMTAIPLSVIATIREDTPKEYQFLDTGFAVTVGQVMASNLGVHHTEWHKVYTGVSRNDMILSAAKSLAALYKRSIASNEESS